VFEQRFLSIVNIVVARHDKHRQPEFAPGQLIEKQVVVA